MTIQSKLVTVLLVIAAIPLLIIGTLSYLNAKATLQQAYLSKLNSVADLKMHQIDALFAGIRADIEIATDYYNVRANLPVLSRHSGDRTHPEYLAAMAQLDSQLKTFQQLKGLVDVMLVDMEGNTVYASNEEHVAIDLGRPLPDPDGKAFSEGMKRTYLTDIFRNLTDRGDFGMLASAPVRGPDGGPIGVIAFEINMEPIYRFIQDTSGLGQTGETLIGQRKGDAVLFLNRLRHDPDAALQRNVKLGDIRALPIQYGAEGESGSGVAIDYRGKQVIAAWRALPSMGWAMVSKIDTDEAWSPAVELRNTIALISAAALLVIALAALLIARTISRPIEALQRGTEIIGQGRLDHRVGTAGKDEVGQLSRAFDAMVQNLKKVMASRDELEQQVAERIAAEISLREALDKLARSNTELEQFAYVASHDLQEPLRMIVGYMQLLERRYRDRLDDEANEFIGYAVDGASRMKGLIQDLLQYSRVGRNETPKAAADVNAALDRAIGNLSLAIEESGAQVSRDALPTVTAVEPLLVQLFQNLIANAIKFRSKETPPQIHVGAQRIEELPADAFAGKLAAGKGGWLFSVRDNGIGIDPQFAERIFQIFQRLHTREEYAGTGIGLAVCKRIVEQHDGQIWVESEAGKGSAFYFTIPS